MQTEPLITWSEPVREYVGFVAQFLGLGAVGFRFAAVRSRATTSHSPDERAFYAGALRRAALIGLPAMAVQAGLFFAGLPQTAARAHSTVGALITGTLQTGSATVLFVLALVGLGLAAASIPAGWPLALVGAVGATLTGVLAGQWARLVNPAHRVAAGLWIGTLFILVVAGLGALLQDERMRAHRGRVAADMVNGFSPLALTCGMLVVASGLTTAWTHLNPLSSLWTTPYGYALIAKLALVAVVFGLGAWNWRRARPSLGSEDAAHAIRRSSRGELTAAALVLVATAILISLPAPRPAGAPTPAPAPAPAPAASVAQ
ncbi:MAG: copper resistance domain protein [Gemmatimonadetes bacterium]|nr:copper resistance domain protein [Gemmatimonadota bacterium]